MIQTRSMTKRMVIEYDENEVRKEEVSKFLYKNLDINSNKNNKNKIKSVLIIFNFILNNINHFNSIINKDYYKNLRPAIISKLNNLIVIIENKPVITILELLLLDLLKNPIFNELIK